MTGPPTDDGRVERIAALRDVVLERPAHEARARGRDREPAGAELFDAALLLLDGSMMPGDLDEPVATAVHRRLAWGDGERAILDDAAAIAHKLLVIAGRELADAEELLELELAVAEACAAIARIVTRAIAGRVVRERAAAVRDEIAHQRLREAIARQRAAVTVIERQLARRGR